MEETETAGTPRWVKVLAIVALAVIVVAVVVLAVGRGGHGPGRHATAGGTSGSSAGSPPGVTHREPRR
jgi:hypothetical protein